MLCGVHETLVGQIALEVAQATIGCDVVGHTTSGSDVEDGTTWECTTSISESHNNSFSLPALPSVDLSPLAGTR